MTAILNEPIPTLADAWARLVAASAPPVLLNLNLLYY